ncbi:MAG: phage tail tip lysozyme [Propionibacteriaceae bacterium]
MHTISRRRIFALTAGLGLAGTLGVTTATPAWAANNTQTAYNFFAKKGLSAAQSAGLVGNFIVESGEDPINPAAKQHGGGPGRGIAQWEGGRRTDLYNYAKSRGLAWSNLGLQLDFVWKELTGKESNALSKLKATNTPKTAAVAVRKYYERPSAHADAARISAANLVYERYSGDTPPPESETEFPLLKKGAKGAAVTTMQYLLRGKGQSLSVDGVFGADTLSKVKAFQKKAGLAVDGVVGPRTWLALVPLLKSGTKGNAVTALQKELTSAGHSLEADGSFGAKTKSAVQSYQKKAKLAVDGVVGPATWGSLID